VLQRVGLALAVVLGGFALLAELLGILLSTWPRGRVIGLSWITGTMLILAGIGLFLWVRHLSTLVSRRFSQQYRELRAFLANCATERLTRLRNAGWTRVRATLDSAPLDEGRAWDEVFAEWDKLDHALARQCAEIVDALTRARGPEPAWKRPPSLADLADQVDRWAMKAMLVSERPREFWQFPLPRLTFLYRFYPMMGSELLSGFNEATEADVVSDADFRFTVSNQCGGSYPQIGRIRRWAQHQVGSWSSPRPALQFVEAMNTVGLKSGMTRRDFGSMLNRMDRQRAD
jgi:hypothetical protein